MHALVGAGADVKAEDEQGFTALLNAVKVTPLVPILNLMSIMRCRSVRHASVQQVYLRVITTVVSKDVLGGEDGIWKFVNSGCSIKNTETL